MNHVSLRMAVSCVAWALILQCPLRGQSMLPTEPAGLFEVKTYLLDSTYKAKRDVLVADLNGQLMVTHREQVYRDSTRWQVELEELGTSRRSHLWMPNPPHQRPFFIGVHQYEGTLILVELTYVCFFVKSADSTWQYQSRLELPNMVLYSRQQGDKIVLWSDQYGSSARPTTYFYRTTLDVPTRTIGAVQDIQLSRGASMMFMQPRSVVSATNGSTLVADVSQYRVKIWTTNRDTVTLERVPPSWLSKDGTDSTLNRQAVPQRDFADFNRVRLGVSLIHRASLLNDSLALVMWTTPRSGDGATMMLDLYYDMWSKNNGKWTLAESDVSTAWPSAPKGLVQHANLSFSTRVATLGDMMYDLREHPGDDVAVTWPSVDAYENACQRYFAEHELRFAITFWKRK